MKEVRFHSEALEELDSILEWYVEAGPKIAVTLGEEIDSIIERIGSNHEQFPVWNYGARKAVLRRFPYSIYFIERRAVIEIVAIAHGRRDPEYWRNRL